jgi:PBSX family phage terminase large subunit
LFGGAAGGGKSEAVLFEAIALCQEWPGCHGLLLRRTFPELKMSLIMRALEKLPRNLYKYRSSDHLLTWLPTNSTIQFGHCEREDDVYRYQGAEFDFEGVDELTQLNEFTIKYLWSRLRSSKPGVVPKFFASTNPGGIGHSFVKRLWVENKLTPDELMAGYKPEDFQFIPSRLDDNKYLNPEYVQNLKSLPENQRLMLLEGSWDVYEGKYFESFQSSVHVEDDFKIPETWRKFRAIDFGRTAPFACLWLAIDYDGVVHVYREYYRGGCEVDENAEEVVRLSGDEKYEYTVIDTAVFAKTGFGETIGDRLRRKGIDCIPAHKDRVAGWVALKQYLHYDYQSEQRVEPRLKIVKSCPNLIEEMRNAIYDKHKLEDMDTNLPDHACDALRYFIMTLRDRHATHPIEDPMKHVNPILLKNWKERREEGFNPNSRYISKY